MAIHCPKCNAGYNLTAKQIGEGRNLQCVKCKEKWFVKPEDLNAPTPQEKVPLAPVNKVSEASDSAKDADAQSNSSKISAILSKLDIKNPKVKVLAISLLAILIVFSGLMIIKNPIIRAVPTMAGFYNMLGVSGTPEQEAKRNFAKNLSIPSDKIERTIEEMGKNKVLIFTGKIKNDGDKEQVLPSLQVTLLDKEGLVIDEWTAQVDKNSLKAGEEAIWKCRFFNPEIDKISEHRVNFVN